MLRYSTGKWITWQLRQEHEQLTLEKMRTTVKISVMLLEQKKIFLFMFACPLVGVSVRPLVQSVTLICSVLVTVFVCCNFSHYFFACWVIFHVRTFFKINFSKNYFLNAFILLHFSHSFFICWVIFHAFVVFCGLFFLNIFFFNSFKNTISWLSNSFNPDQDDMSWSDANYLQRLSSDNKMKSACPNQFQHTSKHFITQLLNFTFHKAQGHSLTE